jgi:hypothetical protein
MQKAIKLSKPYFTKKLESKTLRTVLDSSYHTAYRLYVLINDIFEMQSFYEEKHDKYFITAYIKTDAAPAGPAKKQIWSVMHLQPLLRKKPKYIVKCTVSDKATNKEVFRFRNETLNENVVYENIAYCIDQIERTIKE